MLKAIGASAQSAGQITPPPTQNSGSGWVAALVFAGMAAIAGGIAWIAYSYVSLIVLAAAFGIYPLLLFVVWVDYSTNLDTSRKLRTKLQAKLKSDTAKFEFSLDGLRRELEKKRQELTQQQNATNEARNRFILREAELTSIVNARNRTGGDLTRQLQSTQARVAQLQARIVQLQDEIAREKAVNNGHSARERERQSWRTLPQGYDLETERFAATIANALR